MSMVDICGSRTECLVYIYVSMTDGEEGDLYAIKVVPSNWTLEVWQQEIVLVFQYAIIQLDE